YCPLGEAPSGPTSGPLNAESNIAEVNLARQANELARDLARANPRVYWMDLGVTAAVTWLSLFIATTSRDPAWAITAGVVCILALYRGISFIHELTHLRPDDVPGFHFAWNVL